MEDATIIFEYTRSQAIADGVLVDAQLGDLQDVSAQHVGQMPVSMTASVFALIEKAVENKNHCNDWRGVWHDIMWMSAGARRRLAGSFDGSETSALFLVIITGTGRVRNHTLKVGLSLDETGRPCWTYMLATED